MSHCPKPTRPDRFGDPLSEQSRKRRIFALAPTHGAVWSAVADSKAWRCPCGFKQCNQKLISAHDLHCLIRLEHVRQFAAAKEAVENQQGSLS